jgi:LacI family transcriptional regulator
MIGKLLKDGALAVTANMRRIRVNPDGATPRQAVILDVARLAGVSHQTVSRVLNARPNVRPATRERVLDAIRKLDYHPNHAARTLVTRRTRTIGVISFDTRLFGPASTLLAIEHAARASGYAITLSSVANPDSAAIRSAVHAFAGQAVDGAIVIAPHDSAARGLSGLRAELPVVAVEAGYEGQIPVVSVDQFAGAQAATEHLLGLGHRSVSHVAGPSDWIEARRREEGWRSALHGAGFDAPPVVRGDWSPESGYRAGLELATRSGVTAVFAANDQMALGVMHAFHEKGVRVPEDVSIVGFDNIPESGFFTPSLTTVHQDFDAVGLRGVEMLISLMDGTPAPAEDSLQIPPALVVRSSTGEPPVRTRAASRPRPAGGNRRAR